jgi:hypothetical protein
VLGTDAIHLADQLDEASPGLGLTLVARLEEELGGPVAERRVQPSALGEEPIAEIEKGAVKSAYPRTVAAAAATSGRASGVIQASQRFSWKLREVLGWST